MSPVCTPLRHPPPQPHPPPLKTPQKGKAVRQLLSIFDDEEQMEVLWRAPSYVELDRLKAGRSTV